MSAKRKKVRARAIYSIEPSAPGIENWTYPPVWELPRTAEAYDQIVKQMAKAIWLGRWKQSPRKHWRNWECEVFISDAIDALRAIGIIRPKPIKST